MADPLLLPEYDLACRQLEGVQEWHRRRRAEEDAAVSGRRSREQRLDVARRSEVVREQHRAILARTEQQLRDSADLPGGPTRPRAVVVHRSDWFVDRVVAALARAGVDLLCRAGNGAEAVGVTVAEQPELLLVEDALPMLGGAAVVREVVACAPATAVAAHVGHDDGIGVMLEAGALVAYVRRTSPDHVAAGLVDLLLRTGSPEPRRLQPSS